MSSALAGRCTHIARMPPPAVARNLQARCHDDMRHTCLIHRAVANKHVEVCIQIVLSLCREARHQGEHKATHLRSKIDRAISCRASRYACSLCGALQEPAPWLITVLESLQAHNSAIRRQKGNCV